MNSYIIRLQKYDDLFTIQDKMTWSQLSRIILVFPERKKIVDSRIDFERIQQTANARGNQIALVIRDSAMRSEAKKSGLAVFDSIEKAKKSPWKKSNRILEVEKSVNTNPIKLSEIKASILNKKNKAIKKASFTDRLVWSFLIVSIIFLFIIFYSHFA